MSNDYPCPQCSHSHGRHILVSIGSVALAPEFAPGSPYVMGSFTLCPEKRCNCLEASPPIDRLLVTRVRALLQGTAGMRS